MKNLTTPQVEKKTGVPAATLRYWRAEGRGPTSFSLGRRVFYREADVDAWIEAQYQASARGDSPQEVA